ncbi:ricin B lectin domain-containing protein [Favolaschia claudopus]|uniref:Ricin B lectin domain-containing protein n=1 Tax=Favolaschia claudopus TaxID=2862362 RepID=A0AAW0DRD9_9AGAR
MISASIVALSAFVLSASAGQIQSRSPSFWNAGIQGCVAVPENADGAPVEIHNCNTEDLKLQDWNATFAIRGATSPSPITIFGGSKCLDVTGGVNKAGTKLQTWSCSGGPNQKWINNLDGTFQWAGSNLCIDLTDGKINDGNQLQLWTCDGGNQNQKWGNAPNPDNGGGPQIILGGNTNNQTDDVKGQPFCIGASSNTDGAAVILAGCGIGNQGPNPSGTNFTWSIPFAPLTGQIRTFDNKCLDVPNGNKADGVKLQIWTCSGGPNQQFHIDQDSISWTGNGKVLDISNGISAIGTPIQLWTAFPGSLNQRWQIDPVQGPR